MTPNGRVGTRRRPILIGGTAIIAVLVLAVIVVTATRPKNESSMPTYRPGVTADPRFPSTTVVSITGLAPGAGRLTGHVGTGRPGENGAIPALALTFTSGEATAKTTVQEGAYIVDLPAGTWEVHSDDGNLCATSLGVTAGASQRDDLIWPTGICQDLSGPPANASPPPGPTPPPR